MLDFLTCNLPLPGAFLSCGHNACPFFTSVSLTHLEMEVL